MPSKHTEAFISLFEESARQFNRYDFFSDFVMMSGISMHNSFLKCNNLEELYLSIAKKYKKDDLTRISDLFAELVMGLEACTTDFLGEVFMSLNFGDSRKAQFFTPFEMSKLMAKMSFLGLEEKLQKKPYVTLQEPTCGSGGMIIAIASTMYEMGYNPQQQLWVSCIDIDPLAAMMTYLQLSLLHIPAEVVTGNSLTMEYNRAMKTLSHYMGDWDSKLKTDQIVSSDEFQDLLVKQDAEETKPVPKQIMFDNKEQLSLF